MLPFTHFDLDEFERNFLLMENESSAQSVRGGISAVKLENHVVGGVREKPVLVLTQKEAPRLLSFDMYDKCA